MDRLSDNFIAEMLTKALSTEFAPRGIRVNAIRPGPTDTEIHEPGRLERITPLLPMGRPGKPDEIAATCLFLVSDDGGFITGQTIHVNGGAAYY